MALTYDVADADGHSSSRSRYRRAISAVAGSIRCWHSLYQTINRTPAVAAAGSPERHRWAIWRALAQCPDQYPPSPTTTELMFITDDALRNSIRGDIGAAERAFANFEWKAATVLAGAAIEALLHCPRRTALNGDGPASAPPLGRWDDQESLRARQEINAQFGG